MDEVKKKHISRALCLKAVSEAALQSRMNGKNNSAHTIWKTTRKRSFTVQAQKHVQFNNIPNRKHGLVHSKK